MAGDLRNLTVRLSLDNLNFQNNLAGVNRALNMLRGEFKATQQGLGGFENEVERTRSQIDVLTRTISVQEGKVQELSRLYEQAKQVTGENSKTTQNYASQLNSAVAELNRLDGQLKQTEANLQRMENNTRSTSQRMEEFGNKLQNAGLQIGAVFGGIALTVGGALKEAVQTGAEFEAEIAKVGSKADASKEDLKRLSDAALQLGPMAGSAKSVATAMDDLAAKGYSVNQIITAMPGILSAANASGEDLALTSDTITSALETFKLKATDTSHVADVLAKTANLTAAGMQDMQYSFKYAAAPAAALGISLEQLSAMTGVMANQGIKGEQAGTSLRSALLRLVDPPKEAANQLHDLGVKVTDNQGKFRSFSDIIGDLNKSTANMTNAQKTAAIAHIFGTDAVSGMLAVISAGKPKIDEFTKGLQNSDGASAKAAAQMKDNLAGSLQKLNGALESAKIGIEQALAPALRVIADVVQKVVVGFNSLSPEMKQFIAISAAVVAVVATIAAGLGTAIAASGAFMAAIGALGLTLGGIASTVGIVLGVVAGVVALGVAFYELYKHCKPVQDAVNGIWNAFKGLFQGIAAIAGGNTGKGVNILSSIGLSPESVQGIVNAVNVVKTAFATVKQEFTNVINFIKGVAATAGGDTKGGSAILSAIGLKPETVNTVTTLIGAIRSVVITVVNGIWGFIKAIGTAIAAFWQANGAQIMAFISVAWNGIFGTIRSVLVGIYNYVMMILTGLAAFWNAHGQQIMAIVEFAFTYIKIAITNALNFISAIFQMIFPIILGVVKIAFAGIQAAIQNAFTIVTGIVHALIQLFSGDFSGALHTIENTFKTVWDNVVRTLQGIDLYSIGKNIIEGLVNGVKSMASSVTDAMNGIASSVMDTAKKVLGIHSPSRVMMEIGGYVTEGMAIGMDSNAHKVLNASNNLAKAAIPNINQTNVSQAGSTAGKGSKTINIYPQSVNMNEGELMQVLQRMEVLYG